MRQPISLLSMAVIALAAAVAGCRTPEPRVQCFTAPAVLIDPPARVIVVPFACTPASREAGPMLTQAVALAVQDALKNDVITASHVDERITAEGVLWQRGRVDMDALVTAQKQYLADVFLFGAVTHYRPYNPPLIGLKLRMVSARTGTLLWAAEAAFDARDEETRDLGVEYFNESGLRDKLYGPDLVFVSPKQYATFVAREMLLPLKTKRTRYLQGESVTQ